MKHKTDRPAASGLRFMLVKNSVRRKVSVGCEKPSVGRKPPYPRCTLGHEVLPLGQSVRAAKLAGLTVDEMALICLNC